LIRILDSEIRLITPTDPEGKDADNDSLTQTHAGQKYVQLAHDYLVHSLRDWLTRKQKETRRGRAELLLTDRAAVWNACQENRQLPSLLQWLQIKWLTAGRSWTPPQQRMMRRASRYHKVRSIVATAGLVLLGWAVFETGGATGTGRYMAELQATETPHLPRIIKDMAIYRRWANPWLKRLATHRIPLSRVLDNDPGIILLAKLDLHVSLALLPVDATQVDYLYVRLLTAQPHELSVIRDALTPHKDALLGKLWAVVEQPDPGKESQRLRAAAALAKYDPESEKWAKASDPVVEQLVGENPLFMGLWLECFRPIKGKLLPSLAHIYREANRRESERSLATNILADYAADQPQVLADLLIDADDKQYSVLYPIVAASPATSTVKNLDKIAATLPPEELGSVQRVPFGQRRANAAVTLLRLGEREKVLSVFDMADDLEALTQFIFRCRDRGVRVEELLDMLQIVTRNVSEGRPVNARIRYALLLAIGEYKLEEIPAAQLEAFLKQLGDWYRNDPSSGVHGAAGWLLRQWGQADVVREVDQTAVPYTADREWFTLAITVKPTSPPKPKETPAEESPAAEPAGKTEPTSEDAESKDEATDRQDESANPKTPPEEAKPEAPSEPLPPKTFYYTFIMFPAGDSQIGSFGDEPDRRKDEVRHGVTQIHPFALLDREITFEELIAFSPEYTGFMQQLDAKPEDAGFGTHWYDSVSFCRWLSRQSGLSESDQCYADPETLDKEEYPREPNPEANMFPRNWPLELGRRGFRLPTESEWEVASRAGARTAYGYGSDVALLAHFGWFLENSGKHVHPPRELRPSHRGLFDLHGNLYEWTHDWYGGFGETAVTDSLGAKEGSLRVSRGGGWYNAAAYCRSASRYADDPANRSDDGGFRLSLSSPSGVSSPAEQVQAEAAKPVVAGTEGASAEQRPEMP
jgi:formylglycine-generating enzyme required for sulfatase activity